MSIEIEKHVHNKFRSLSDPQMRELHRALKNGEEAQHGVKGEPLREIVWNAYNAAIGRPVAEVKPAAVVVPARAGIPKVRLNDQPPNFSSGEWPGRKRIVELQISDEVTQKYGKNFSVNGVEVGLFPGVPTSVPYSIYDNIRRKIDVTETDSEGRRLPIQVTRQEASYPFTDHGDDQTTLDKPISSAQWYAWQCESNEFYRLKQNGGKTQREHLRRVFEVLDERRSANLEWMRDRSDEELRNEILRLLGFHDVIRKEQDAELEEELAA